VSSLRARRVGLLAALAVCLCAAPGAGQEVSIRVAPQTIARGAFSGVSQVRIEGTIASGARAVVVIRGSDSDETFNRKGRFGPIWINAGKVEVTGAPSLFLAFWPAPLETFLGQDAIDRWQLDIAAIRTRLGVQPSTADGAAVRADYLALKAEEGSYHVARDGVRIEPEADGRSKYVVELAWPRTARPGTYQATVYECSNNTVSGSASTAIDVEQAGVAALLRNMAEERATFYGAIAVAIMLGLGFGIDFLVARLRRSRARPRTRPPVEVARH
jgi:hypothetical protein